MIIYLLFFLLFFLLHPFFCCTFVAPTLVFPLAFTFFISSYSFSISCLSDPHYLSSSSLFSPSSSSLSISPLLLRYVSLIPSFHSSYISSPLFPLFVPLLMPLPFLKSPLSPGMSNLSLPRFPFPPYFVCHIPSFFSTVSPSSFNYSYFLCTTRRASVDRASTLEVIIPRVCWLEPLHILYSSPSP